MTQPTPTNDADEIQRQMREVRAELRDDVQDLVYSAHQLADWTSYVKAYPWLCVGAAVAAGFLIVPQRSVVIKPNAADLLELAKKHKLVVKMDEGQSSFKKKRGGFMAELLGLAATTLLHNGLKVATQQVSQAFNNPPHSRSNGRAGGVTP
jgi:hypothetical protein